ncbi:MAG TPA: hypothetical protein VE967_19005 [Gemmatimonadaceae bacterium]|nr:hypothetical protein [Gemmatimonadaceae bacterium]
MRFDIVAAYVLGILLPAAETVRRGTHFTPIASYADDYIIGALLLAAAHAARIGKPSGNALLVAAWGALCGGLYYSFFGQLESATSTDVSGLPNMTVVVIKGAIYLVALYAIVRSIRAASQQSMAS